MPGPDMNKIAENIRNNPAMRGVKVQVIKLTPEQIAQLNGEPQLSDTLANRNPQTNPPVISANPTTGVRQMSITDLQKLLNGRTDRNQSTQ